MLFRVLFILIYVALGLTLGNTFLVFEKVIYTLVGVVLLFFFDFYIIRTIDVEQFLSIFVFLSLGLFIFSLTVILFRFASLIPQKWDQPFILLGFFFVIYVGLNIAVSTTYFKKGESEKKQKHAQSNDCLIDSSAIIDGRLLVIAKTGFLPKTLVIPEFVIRELQLISDSSNPEKRFKGRRGLDFIKEMKASDLVFVKITEEDMGSAKEVDGKLLAMAKKYKCKIVTTDYNLIQVAKVEGIEIMNVNHLASLLKPNINVGDKMKVIIHKKGNGPNQGISLLEDDTMLVVEDAEKLIGSKKDVVITHFNQSETGKIAFAKLT